MTVHIEPQLDGNVSMAWLRTFNAVQASAGHEAYGVVTEIRSSGGSLIEISSVREALDKALDKIAEERSGRARRPTLVQTVASTIFPTSMWNPAKPRNTLFERYLAALPIIKKDPRNKDGTYFSRFLEHNQLEHVLSTRLEHGNHRRSAYQLIIFDPTRDHGDWRQKGFPCLHQVSFVPDAEAGTLGVVGYYPTQTIFEKAYGNYIGLWDLGCFVAHEWSLRMESLICFTVVAKAANGKNNALAAGLHRSLKGVL